MGRSGRDAPLQRVAPAAGGGSRARGGGGVRGGRSGGRGGVAARGARLRLRHAQVDLRLRHVIASSGLHFLPDSVRFDHEVSFGAPRACALAFVVFRFGSVVIRVSG